MKLALSREIKSSTLPIPKRPHSRQRPGMTTGNTCPEHSPSSTQIKVLHIHFRSLYHSLFAAQSLLYSAVCLTASLRMALQFFDPVQKLSSLRQVLNLHPSMCQHIFDKINKTVSTTELRFRNENCIFFFFNNTYCSPTCSTAEGDCPI